MIFPFFQIQSWPTPDIFQAGSSPTPPPAGQRIELANMDANATGGTSSNHLIASDLEDGYIVLTAYGLGAIAPSATFNGVAMTQISIVSDGANQCVLRTYGLAVGNLAAGSYPVTIGAGGSARYIVTSFEGVDQADPYGILTAFTGGSSGPTLAVPSNAGDYIFLACHTQSGIGTCATLGLEPRFFDHSSSGGADNFSLAACVADGPESVGFSFHTGNLCAALAIPLQPSTVTPFYVQDHFYRPSFLNLANSSNVGFPTGGIDNWSYGNPPLQIVGGAANGNGNISTARYTGVAFNADQYAQCRVPITGLADTGLIVRASADAGSLGADCYLLSLWPDGTQVRIVKFLNGVATVLATEPQAIAANNTIKFVAQGNSLTGYREGVAIISATDADLPSGAPGIYINTNNAKLDDFEAGHLT